ncbi:hypothetical protein CLAIMM_11135 [Cladophialophora immunda]|nr:hypothetical protein CLAIMM_11135 [Cladophialophora immunda]
MNYTLHLGPDGLNEPVTVTVDGRHTLCVLLAARPSSAALSLLTGPQPVPLAPSRTFLQWPKPSPTEPVARTWHSRERCGEPGSSRNGHNPNTLDARLRTNWSSHGNCDVDARARWPASV